MLACENRSQNRSSDALSSFFSNKYLKYRGLLGKHAPAIATDVFCAGCGYNLRGLTPGRNCPECGRQIPVDFTQATDPLLSGDAGQKALVLWGLSLVALAAAASVASRLLFSVLWSMHVWLPLWTYLALSTAISATWTVGVTLATPRRLDPLLLGGAILRLLARCSQWVWLPATVCALLAETKFSLTPQGDRLASWALGLSIVGWLGGLAFAFVLVQVAEALEIEDASRRIGMAIWTVPALTAVLMIMPLQANFLLLGMMGPLVLAWGWYFVGFARGVWEIRQHVAWGIRAGSEGGDREARIARTKAEIEREVAQQVRPLPPPPHAPPTTPQPRRKR